MSDQEKQVIDGLERCCEHGYRCLDCPYEYFGAMCTDYLAHDALELLKDKEPKHTQWVYEPDRTNHWHCSGCGYVTGLAGLMGNFCPNCGAKVQKKTEEELRKEVSGGWLPVLSFSQCAATAGK